MLAPLDLSTLPCEPMPDLDYSGYPDWRVLMTEPAREEKSAHMLQHVNIWPYLPRFSKQCRAARGQRIERQVPVMPMLLFVPAEMLDVPERDAILKWAGLRFAKLARMLTKIEVEVIREIEGKLNVRFDKKTYNFQPGQRVRFLNELWAAFLGEGDVIEVASGNRISIKVEGSLFGGKDTLWVPAAEVEVM
jgi:hypothetical protein